MTIKKKTSWNKGLKMPEKQREMISRKLKGKRQYIMTDKIRKKISDSVKNNPTKYWLGKHHSEETKKKISINNARVSGEKHWNWRGGITNNPYPKEFTKELRLKIRTRDNFTCCLCGKTEREELEELNRILCVNHIDFNKNNCAEKNLNTLCVRCNVKINKEREYWTDYFNTKNDNI